MKLASLLIFFLIPSVFAFKFSPMSLTLKPLEGQTSSMVYIENDHDKPIAIQISLMTRSMDLSGNEKNTDATSELSAYPTQLIVSPFEKKSIKVSWIGKELGLDEMAYRIIAEQLPIDIEKQKAKKKGNINVLLKYVGALYVDSGKTESKIAIKKFLVEGKELLFWVENKGSQHQILTNLKIELKKDKDVAVLSGEKLKGFLGENILPHSERLFKLPITSELKKVDSNYQVVINFEQE